MYYFKILPVEFSAEKNLQLRPVTSVNALKQAGYAQFLVTTRFPRTVPTSTLFAFINYVQQKETPWQVCVESY